MLHLPTERLAALGDEPPTDDEAGHLATCASCARECGAYETLVSMAHAEREPFGLPLTRWDAISAELAKGASAPVVIMPAMAVRTNRRLLRIAAGLLLMAGGAMAGRASAGASVLPSAQSVAQAPAPASAGQTPDSNAFATVDDARAAQQRSEVTYQQAAAFLARFDTTGTNGSPVAYRSRLAALDRVISTTREAMRQAPHDPVINGYYLTTLGQREATLRQLNTSLPSSLRVNSF
ncbi:MAG: hypothetical protein JWM95_1106 [Gemmatimonadetes bacterium]|nr:hypothetical protein [Gemmatimonadota bacterium]